LKRTIVHALCIVTLFGLGWALRLTENTPLVRPWAWLAAEWEALGIWGWAPAALGCLGLGLCLVACLVVGSGRRFWLPALLVVPALCLTLCAALFYIEIRDLVNTFADADVRNGNYSGAVQWLSGHAYFAQLPLVRGTRWAALSLVGAAIAAGCTAAPDHDKPDGLRLGWPLVTFGAVLLALTVYVFGCARIFRSIGESPIQWGDLGRTLESLTYPAPLVMQLPVFVGLSVLGLLPLVLMNLRPQLAELQGLPTRLLDSARATAATATLAAGVAFGLGAWLSASSSAIQLTHWALSSASFESRRHVWGILSGYSSSLTYIAGVPLSLATLAVAVVVAAPMLVTSLRAWPRWMVPFALVAIPWLLFAGIRGAALPHISRYMDPGCTEQCTDLDRIATLLALSRLQHNRQIIRDRCDDAVWVRQGRSLTIARYESDQCPDIAVNLRLEQHAIQIDGVSSHRTEGTPLTCDPDLLSRVRVELAEKIEQHKAVAVRNPGMPRFEGHLTVIPDRDTPAGTLDCLLAAAFEAGFTKPSVVVARPAPPFPLLVRIVELHADPAMLPDAGSPIWSVHLSPSEAILTSPEGEVWSAATAGELVPEVRETLSHLKGSPILWVYRSPDLPLQTDLDARTTLTTPGMFVEAWSLPLGEEPVQWVPPEKPNHPAVP
jgi:hypothetical protein